MKIKKFEAETMQKALDEVKRELGRDAVILHTKTYKKNGFLGLWGKEMVEITASDDINLMDDYRKPKKSAIIQKYTESSQAGLKTIDLTPQRIKPDDKDLDLLHSNLKEVKSLVMSILKRSHASGLEGFSEELMEAYLLLIEQEVSEELSKDIVKKINNVLVGEQVKNKTLIKQTLHKFIMQMFKTIRPIELNKDKVKKVAFIGPTGVGKTTTIAKLAADFSLRQKKKVALITADTYRIAAVEQLRTYADIINIPLEVVLSPNEIERALQKHIDKDLILIDTAGRSQKNTMQMQELKTYVEAIEPDETHLVLSVTANYKNMQDIIDRFGFLSVDKIIFTKLDEAVTIGLILNVISKLDKSLSYVTIGQNVPDDILTADPDMIADIIINGDK